MKLVDLTVSREIDATPEEVFDAWTDPSKFGAWFGVSRLIMDPVVDGLYYIAVDYQGRIWPHYGRQGPRVHHYLHDRAARRSRAAHDPAQRRTR